MTYRPFGLAVALTPFIMSVGLRANAQSAGTKSLPADIVSKREQVLEDAKGKLKEAASLEEALLIDKISMVLVKNDQAFLHALSRLDHSGMRVEISTGFMDELGVSTELLMLSAKFGLDVQEEYHKHRVASTRYDDVPDLEVMDFVTLSEEQRAIWEGPETQQTLRSLFGQALFFVIAHEIGHHVTRRYYDPSQPAVVNAAMEQSVDVWAAKALIAAGMPPVFGAFLMNTHFSQLETHLILDENARTHPRGAERSLAVLDSTKDAALRIFRTPPWNQFPIAKYVELMKSIRSDLISEINEERKKTVAWYRSQARSGDVDAQLRLAAMYRFGVDVKINPHKEYEYFLRAANQGDPDAQEAVGRMLAWGTGVGQNFAMGLYWLKQASEAELELAKINLEFAMTSKQAASAQHANVCLFQCVDRGISPLMKTCLRERHQACLSACTNGFGNPPELCDRRFCRGVGQKRSNWSVCSGRTQPQQTEAWEACRSSCGLLTPNGAGQPAVP